MTADGAEVALSIRDLPCACLKTSAERRIVDVNDFFLAHYGWTRNAIFGSDASSLFTRASQVFCDTYVYPTAMTQPVCSEVQLTVLTGTGDRRPVVANVSLLGDGGFAWVLMEAENRRNLFEELEQARNALLEQREQLDLLSRTDGLTGVLNRRGFEDAISKAFAQSDRDGTPISVLLMDIDHFKALNDGRGHQCGDEALVLLGDVLASTCRETDIVGRFGGDEFVCALPQTGVGATRPLCERIHAAVSERSPSLGGFTISLGVAARKAGARDDWPVVLSVADRALYDAKAAGRNTTVSKSVCGP